MSVSDNTLTNSEIDLQRFTGYIQRQTWWALLTTVLVCYGFYLVLPRYVTLPTEPLPSLIFAIQLALIPLLWLLTAVAIVAKKRRQSMADVHGSAYAEPSKQLAVPAAFLQNTLEQVVLLVGALLLLGTVLSGDQLAILIAMVILFSIGRYLFYTQYTHNPYTRVLGMVLTMLPALFGYTIALCLVLYRLVL